MKIEKKNIYVIKETIIRKTLNDHYWPTEQRNFKRQKLIDANKREGWIGHFLNNGLTIEGQILISKNDYAEWPKEHKTKNINVISSELLYFEEFSFELNNPALVVRHASGLAEEFRKNIYISAKFRENADRVWAAQFFDDPESRDTMLFTIGFDRPRSRLDDEILGKIKIDALSLKGQII